MENAAIMVTIGDFRKCYSKKRFTQECHDYVEKKCGLPVDDANDRSWDDCYEFLIKYLPQEDKYQKFHLVFEFMMPESQCRVDALILSHEKVISLEFKQKKEILKNDIAQAAGYGQSILHYHFQAQENNMNVLPFLVYTPGDPEGCHDIINILCPANFTNTIKNVLERELPLSNEECREWIASPFHPLKNIAEATLQLFRDGDLPNIKSIREGDIKNTLAVIDSVINDPKTKKSILFISGVPGSGKTLVGLKTVYDHACPENKLNPIYLSGNDPLVNILQNTLSNNPETHEGGSYIQPMKNFKEHARGDSIPMNDVIVFDEAQRAWDIDREPNQTEATILLRIGDRIAEKYGKITLICLIGDGQAIHKNEETGIRLWIDALVGRKDWNVYVPERYGDLFKNVEYCASVSALMLDTSIRHDFIDVSPWVEAIIDLNFNEARSQYQKMLSQGFNAWVFRDQSKLQQAVKYVQDNYPGSHTGLVVSSHMKNVSYFGREYKGSYVKATDAYHWYMNEGSKLIRGASEFLIQGIELEYPIVGFVGDYYIQNGRWNIDGAAFFDSSIRDRETLIKNVYRVLLTRSRKGMFLYIPDDRKLDETFIWFKKMLNI